MPAPVPHHRWVVRDGLVQVPPVEWPPLGQLGVVVLEAADPLAGGRLASPRRHAVLDLGDAPHIDIHVLQLPHPRARRMGVCVDEPRCDHGVTVVQDLRARDP